MEANAVTAPTAPRDDLKQSAAALPQKSAKIKFEVVAGVHQGAELLLNRSDYRIGSSPNADIVLSDPGVAAEHAVLRIEHSTVRIDAIGADVTVEQTLLPVLRGRRVRLPVSLAVGAARVSLSDPDRNGSPIGEFSRRLSAKPLAAAGVFACLVLAITVVAQGPQKMRTGDLATTTGSSVAGALEHSTPGSASTANSDGQSKSTVEDAAHELSARLDAAKIRTLRVSAVDGRLAVAGKVSKQDAIGWAAIQQWFDQTYGGHLVLTPEIGPDGEMRRMPAFQLQAIYYGEHPYIVSGDGERYFEGAVLDNGWIIRQIGEDRVLLAKDGEPPVALTYR